MNCVLTRKQQELLFGKVAIDLKNIPNFEFGNYARDFYNLIVEKTGDKVLAASYVQLLPMNIRALLGVSKVTAQKLKNNFAQIVDLESSFEDFANVEGLISSFNTEVADAKALEQDIQAKSLSELPEPTKPIPTPEIIPNVSLWDLNFDTTKEGQLKPEMRLYTEAKKQLITNKKEDGSSAINGVPVKLMAISTSTMEPGDFYPDTEKEILAGNQRIIEYNKKGVVLAVTDLLGNIIYFDQNQNKVDKGAGKPIYYIFKAPKQLTSNVYTLDFNEQAYVTQLQRQRGLTQAQAEGMVKKQNEAFKLIRDMINTNPSSKLDMLITGGINNIVLKPTPQQLIIGNVFDFQGNSFKPYKGLEGKENVYYFDYPGTKSKFVINRPDIPVSVLNKLVQLLSEDVVNRYEESYKTKDKIKLFNQFVYLHPAVMTLKEGADGQLEITHLGTVLNFNSKEEKAKYIRDLLVRNTQTRPLSVADVKYKQSIGKRIVTEISGAEAGNVYEHRDGDKISYFEVGPVQLKIDKTAADLDKYIDFSFDVKDGKYMIKETKSDYYPFIKDNFLIDRKQYPKTAGQVLEFSIAPQAAVDVIKAETAKVKNAQYKGLPLTEPLFDEKGDLNPKVYEKTTPKTNSGINEEINKPLGRKAWLASKKDLFKLQGQEFTQATEDQINTAEKWYNESPLSKYFPFTTLFDVVNRQTPNAIAKWTTSGITLYKGADYSDLYHEAWHGFTQGFLSSDDKVSLYDELLQKSGSFVDYNGNRVDFSNAKDLQIEEYLAEDFREYMLSDGKKVLKDFPKRNSIFRKILNFLKELFGSSTVRQNVTNEGITQKVAELYRKLRVGDLSSYTFAAENRNYDTLNKALTAINPNESERSLSFENSGIIYSAVNSLFSEAVDMLNQLNLTRINRERTLQSKVDKTPADLEELAELKSQIQSNYTTLMTSTPKGIKTLYSYAKHGLQEKLADYKLIDQTSPTAENMKKIELLKYALRNFGNIDNLAENRADEGVVGYHLYKTDLIEKDTFAQILEDEEDAGRELEGKEYYDRGGNEKSPFEVASREITNLLKSLHQTDENGDVLNDIFGFPKLLNHKGAFAYILRTVENSKDLSEMVNKLKTASKSYYPIKQLLDKMGPVYSENQTERETDLWSKFFQTFNKYRIQLVQTTVNKSFETNPDGSIKGPITYDIKIGNALADTNRVNLEWRAQFAKETENIFIKNDEKGNYLDTKKLLDKYSTLESITDPMEFLQDIGIKFDKIPIIKETLEEDIKSGSIRLSGIYNNITKLNAGGIVIRNIGTYLTANKKLGISGLIGQTGPNSNYGKLLELQTKYSSDYSDYMVQNAAGDPQSEYSQNNSLTQKVKQLNSAKSYVELVNNPITAEYNNTKGVAGRPYNPFINSSIMMNAMFHMNSSTGPTRNNKIVIDNLSGINSSVNDGLFKEGVALSQADEIGKLHSDFHTQLMKFTPELTRHAGKKTSLAVYLRNYYTGTKNKRLYIDTESFVSADTEVSSGANQFHQILVKYLGAELDRVNYAKELLNDKTVEFTDFSYLKRGSKFVAFAGVLSEEMKEELYQVKGNLSDYLNSDLGITLDRKIRDEVLTYFNNLVSGVQTKIEFISPNLLERVREDASVSGTVPTDPQLNTALSRSFVANNWVHHFEEMIMLYGDIALYKDFFKRNASLNSTGDVIRNDAEFIKTVNEKIKKGFTEQLGITMEQRPYKGIYNAAIVSDVLTKSVYLDKYKEASKSNNIDEKYGEKGVNEADAQGLISFDTYRIVLKSLGKWSNIQEGIYQDLLAGKFASEISAEEMFPTLKMGYFGPVQSEYLPLTGLHKFALFPLIPGVIPSNLQELHEKMMREGVDYVTFESGSKVGNIAGREIKDGETVGNKFNPFYSDINTRTLNTEPFIKTTIFPEYLKYQVENAPYFKGQLTLATQLRKLVDIGLIEEGVPTDFIPDGKSKNKEEAWEKLTETQKKAASKNYTLRSNYLDVLRDMVNNQKEKLLSEIGWKEDKDGNVVAGKLDSLLELLSSELKRSDVGDHEWAFIQTLKEGIKNPLDISTSADMIEKVLVSLINKRLVNIKVKGEQLVLVSTTGFEDKAFAYQQERNFEKPTQEDLEKYGTNDLPTYHIGKDGVIKAAKVKIALQGDFKKLLQLSAVKAKSVSMGITPFQALNLLLKDEDWVGENRSLITMVGARIPTQGINSAEFVEVYEFLPEIAGNIIIAPSEITSKGGSDFDFDKLPLMMPNIKINKGQPELAKTYSKGEAKEIYDELLKFNIHKMTFKGLTKSEIRALLQTSDRFTKIEDVLSKLWGPSYFEDLVKIVQEDKMKSFDAFYNDLNAQGIENRLIGSLRAILEQPGNFEALITPNDTNLVKPLADAIYEQENGKDAKSKDKEGTRMFEPLHNLKVQQANSIGKDTLGIGAIYNTFNAVFNSIGLTLNSEYGGKKSRRRAKLFFKHNTKDGNISLSQLKDAEDNNSVSEVVSQLINGWVDVEKDDWISNIQGNKEVAPVLLFMLRAGVPIRDVVYFVTQPIIKKYVEAQRINNSSFAEVLGRGGFSAKTAAKKEILEDPLNDFNLPDLKGNTIYDLTTDLVKNNFDTEELKTNITNPKVALNKAVFLHFLEIEDMAQQIDSIQRAFNVDTSTLLSINALYGKTGEIVSADQNTLISQKFIQRLKDKTAIGPFYVQPFALSIIGKLLPLRANPVLNNFMFNLPKEAKELFKDDETMYKTFKDDLLQYLFQKEMRSFDTTGMDLSNVVMDGMSSDVFTNTNEYYHYIDQVNRLRQNNPLNQISGDIEYNEMILEFQRKDGIRLADETDEQFQEKVEKLAYEEWLKNKALYDILNPHKLFKDKFGIAGKYVFILNKYPTLKTNFSLLSNIKSSYKDGINNLQLSTMKLSKDEIDIFHENFKDLSNSSKLINLGLSTKEADYVSEFFSNLPMYLYMQTGPNTRNPFSFNRVMPNDKILEILAKPVKNLVINDKFLEEYLARFVEANGNTATRNRFKDYLHYEFFEPILEPVRTEDEVTPTVDEIADVEPTAVTTEPQLISNEDLEDQLNCKKIV